MVERTFSSRLVAPVVDLVVTFRNPVLLFTANSILLHRGGGPRAIARAASDDEAARSASAASGAHIAVAWKRALGKRVQNSHSYTAPLQNLGGRRRYGRHKRTC